MAGLALLLLVLVLANKAGTLAPDIKPEIYLDPWGEFHALRHTWRESPKLGEPNFNVGLFPVAGVVGALQALGLGPDLSMRVLRWLLLLLGAWGARRLTDEILGSRSSFRARSAAAVVYVANPYVVTSGDFLANLLAWSLLPWMVWALVRALRRGGWKWPAVAALAFAAQSGMNAGVIPLIQLVCIPAVVLFVRVSHQISWPQLLSRLLRWILLVLLVSVYWLVPSLSALGAGEHVTSNSETIEGIAGVSSLAEALRGLGLWPLYGGDVDGPWQPGFIDYLVNPLVVAATFILLAGLVVAVRMAAGPVVTLGLWLVVPAALVMVGAHPPGNPTPLGQALLWAFDEVPGAAAFRTTNKVGAVMVLGLAVLAAATAGRVGHRLQTSGWARPAYVGAGLAVVGMTAPVWSGGMYSLPLPVPDYWFDAARTVDRGPGDERVWFVPGVNLAHYTWSEDRPDDLNNALFTRPSFTRFTIPESSPGGANLLAALDTALHEGRTSGELLSSAAYFLGVGDVLVRNDVRWDRADGTPAVQVAIEVGQDDGLEFESSFGRLGENVLVPSGALPLVEPPPPLQWYSVARPGTTVRAEPDVGTVLIEGDNWALAAMAEVGLLEDLPSYRLVGDLDAADFAEHLDAGSRIVLTDTNRRHPYSQSRLTGAFGPIVAAEVEMESSLTLFESSSQTVLDVIGGRARASEEPLLFGGRPSSSPENAFDKEPTTRWLFGDFGRAPGQWIEVEFDDDRPLGLIPIRTESDGPVRVSTVDVSVEGYSTEVSIGPSGVGIADLRGRESDWLRVTTVATSGAGFNPVAITDVDIAGVDLQRVARMPTRLADLVSGLDTAGRSDFERTRVDVLMTRASGRLDDAADDEEVSLSRNLVLPDDRSYAMTALIRPSEPDSPASQPGACQAIALLDGRPVLVRAVAAATPDGRQRVVGCETVRLSAGAHTWRPLPGWTVDSVLMRDQLDRGFEPPAEPPAVDLVSAEPSDYVVAVDGSTDPFWLVLDQNWNGGWSAFQNGASLGVPAVVDGYALGWRLDPGDSRQVTIRFEPQRWADAALVVSTIALAACAVLAIAGANRRHADADASHVRTAPPSLYAWVLAVVLAGLATGLLGAAVAVAVGIVVRCGGSPKALLTAALGFAALVPLSWVTGNLVRWGRVSPDLVLENPWPSAFATVVLVTTVVVAWSRTEPLKVSASEADHGG
jgi:arabinofuranan 3-O-arabinosyltransferase